MKPRIGITTSMEVEQDYYMVASANVQVIKNAGGLPVLLPYMESEEDIEEVAQSIDGLYATGGYDIDPTLFGEEPHPNLGTIIPERDTFELALMKRLLELNKPILGVCRGAQTLNLAAGGTMFQDIYSQAQRELLQHQQKAPKGYGSHFVHVVEGSLLHRLTGKKKLRVNSRHHQANRSVTKTFLITGRASDGIIEAVESTTHRFALGVQWHPENMVTVGDEASFNIYKGFIEACKLN
ncbi:gamma-glutamyl-gamma-aminobutyrate hydrolase family protein [Ornithinibacillus halophilus]|uniref:Putative glutamine amidotransferase n=1 Tax=Ornithinibacillus halophilus TaxID=930117 RepID=A0A1M5MCM8_9BACI|nr:gamma-glutamyl-gamma-aminobutyrate hydrolase family protein [Ornithinibacillus halophilus]SHG75038.1 putative glutamine amidotransferase [Ornithinibacillus halophilus]